MNSYTLALLFNLASSAYNLPPGLLYSVCYVETKHNINAIHRHDGKGDSLGVCQIKLATAKHMGYLGTAKGLMRPDVNINYAAKYLAYQLHRYHHNITVAVISYNIGSSKNLKRTRYSDTVLKQWRSLIAYERTNRN